MSLLKRVLGNGNEELAEEMRGVLRDIQQERDRYETLIQNAREASTELEHVAEAGERLEALEARLAELNKLATQVAELDERATTALKSQQEAEARIGETVEASQKASEALGEIAGKVDIAVSLKDELASFLEVDKPLSQLRG